MWILSKVSSNLDQIKLDVNGPAHSQPHNKSRKMICLFFFLKVTSLGPQQIVVLLKGKVHVVPRMAKTSSQRKLFISN